MALRKRILKKQEPIIGSFSPDCLSSPVEETVLSFGNVVLQGPKSTIDYSGRVQSGSDAALGTRAKIACTLSQLLIFNTVKHASSSDNTVIRHNKDRVKPKPKLSDRDIIVPPVVIKNDDVFVPRSCDGHVQPTSNLVHSAKVKDEAWISHVAEVMHKGELMKGDVITWAGFNSQIRSDECIKPGQAEIGILPLFPEKAASPYIMMKHKNYATTLHQGITKKYVGDSAFGTAAPRL